MSSFHDVVPEHVAASPPPTPSPAAVARDAAAGTSPFVPQRNLTPTPSRMLVAPVRQSSADRGLSLRSNSAGKALNRQSERGTELAKAVYDAQSCNRAMSTSRRKQRQWENNNCLDMFLSSRRKSGKNGEDEEEEEEEEDGSGRFMLRVDWRSAFSKLFAKENVDALEMIRKCAESGDDTNRRNFVQHSKRRMLSVGAGAAEWRDAEVAWLKVEKRLRGVVAPAIKKSNDLCDFVLALQVVLCFFGDTQTAPPAVFVPDALSRYLRAPLELAKSTASSSSSSSSPSTSAPTLVVSLVDSSFHRLLLHATCQFLGLKSRSMETNSSTQQKQRSTHCSLPRSGPSVIMKSQTSLVAFLHFAEDAVSERE